MSGGRGREAIPLEPGRSVEPLFHIFYCHEDCPVQPGVAWEGEWSCACNDDCPACGREIEPVSWEQLAGR